jgi:hypothetical protein
MAAKGKSTAKAAKGKAKPKTTKVRKSATAALSPAQFKAYQTAAQKAQQQQQAQALRQRRLASVARVNKKLAVARKAASRSAVAAFAAQQTFRQAVSGHQSAMLRKRSAANLFRLQQRATQARFIFRGESIHAHTTRMQTVTSAQAASTYQKYRQSAIKRNNQKLKSKNLKPRKKTTAKKTGGYSAAAKSAGMRAARQVRPTQATKAKNAKTNANKAAQSKKKSAAKPKQVKAAVYSAGVNREWVTAGNTQGIENCAAVALANHMLAWTGYRLTDDQVMDLHFAGGDTLAGVIKAAGWDNVTVGMAVPLDGLDGFPVGSLVSYDSLVNYDTPRVPHAAVLLDDGNVATWGEVMKLTEPIEEGWFVQWRV